MKRSVTLSILHIHIRILIQQHFQNTQMGLLNSPVHWCTRHHVLSIPVSTMFQEYGYDIGRLMMYSKMERRIIFISSRLLKNGVWNDIGHDEGGGSGVAVV